MSLYCSVIIDHGHGKVSLQTSRGNNKQELEIRQSMLKGRKDNCTIKVRYGKVLICGASAAGKTNFLNLLMEENFQPKHISTVLAERQKVSILESAITYK